MHAAIYERVKLVSLKPDQFIWYNKIKLYFVESNLLLEYFLKISGRVSNDKYHFLNVFVTLLSALMHLK